MSSALRPDDGRLREVSVATVREAVQRSGVNPSELARRLGWWRPDDRRVRRQLGVDADGTGGPARQTMSAARAMEIAEALDLDPVDIGL